MLEFYDGRPVKTSADWQERRQEILKLWHEVMGAWPPLIETPKIEYLEKEHTENFTRHNVCIEVAPERTIVGYLLIPDGNGPFPAVLDVFYGPEIGAGLNEERRLQNDFGYQLTKRGFVSLCSLRSPTASPYGIGSPGGSEVRGTLPAHVNEGDVKPQPLSYLAYVSANCYNLLANLPEVDPERVGTVGHSFGGNGRCLLRAFMRNLPVLVILTLASFSMKAAQM